MLESVAGIAMGLVLEPDGSFVVLSDIQGSEDALGDMDFKVCCGVVWCAVLCCAVCAHAGQVPA